MTRVYGRRTCKAMFTGKQPIQSAASTVVYHQGLQPQERLKLLRDCITLLDRCVAAARGHAGDPLDKQRDASLNLGVGFAMLAMSESRALLALVSIGLERSARIHSRSLHEYAFRAGLVLADAQTAHRYKIAAAREMKKYAGWFKLDDARVQEAAKQYLEDADPGQEVKREKDALGGDMASLMRKATGDNTKYASTFGYPSLFSHGSILALYEVSEAIVGEGNDFAEALFRDGLGPDALLDAGIVVLQIVLLLARSMGIDVLDEFDAVKERFDRIVARDGFLGMSPKPAGTP